MRRCGRETSLQMSARTPRESMTIPVCPDNICVARVTPTLAASLASATRTPTAAPSAPARTTSVSTPAPSPVVRAQTALSRTTWPSAAAPEAPPETPSGAAGGSPVTRSAPPVASTQTAR